MKTPTGQRAIIAWLLVAALAFNMAWPSFAQAGQAGNGAPLVICTTTGFQTIAFNPAGKSAPLHLPGKPHCFLCLNPCVLAILPAGVTQPAWRATLLFSVVQLYPATLRTRAPYTFARSRAPPGHFS